MKDLPEGWPVARVGECSNPQRKFTDEKNSINYVYS